MIFVLPFDIVLSFWGFIFNRRIACSLGTVFLATNLGQFITNLAYYIFLLLLHVSGKEEKEKKRAFHIFVLDTMLPGRPGHVPVYAKFC